MKKLRFKGFNDKWQEFELGNIGETFTGLSGKTKEDFGHGNAKYISYLSIFNNPFVDIEKLEKIEIDESQNQVQYGDIFFTTSSETPEEVGMSSVWLYSLDNVYLNSFCFGYRLNIKTNLFFISYCLRSKFFRQQMQKLAQGISRFNISPRKTMELKIKLPSLQEQVKIGELFKSLDESINKTELKISKLKQSKKALLDKLFTTINETYPQLRFKGFSDKWQEFELGNIGKIITGNTPSTLIKENYQDNGFLWVTPTDISKNIIDKSSRTLSVIGKKIARVAPKNSILVTCIASIGKNALLMQEGAFNQQINALIPSENFYPYFLIQDSFNWSKTMEKLSTNGLMQIINKDKFSKLKTKLPSMQEQVKIGELFKSLDESIGLYEKKLNKLKQIKLALLNKVFKGE